MPAADGSCATKLWPEKGRRTARMANDPAYTASRVVRVSAASAITN
jgi:hypothetical protein